LLIPYPFASGDHQRVNAESLVRAGAALCLPATEATPERIAREITALFGDSARLSRMAERATRLGRPEAAHAIAMDLLGLAGLADEMRRIAKGPAAPRSSEPPVALQPLTASHALGGAV
jgi:UDP-N-acetylglucosamine--N-acetylmuramyl-(pentapeptide) pyrophosphoryl-undecaprenol N-acetylglucosamine transferase